jgi:hypothetical protein
MGAEYAFEHLDIEFRVRPPILCSEVMSLTPLSLSPSPPSLSPLPLLTPMHMNFLLSSLVFGDSQGRVEIFNLLFEYVQSSVKKLIHTDYIKEDKLFHSLAEQIEKDLGEDKAVRKPSAKIMQEMISGHGEWMHMPEHARKKVRDALVKKILCETVSKYKNQQDQEQLFHEDFVRRIVVNRKDKHGNTMLHLAAWNSKPDMYDHLIMLGADPTAENEDGLTAFTLSVRFGRWEMFQHIWARHFTRPYWRFGNVEGNVVDYSQYETNLSGFGGSLSSQDLRRHVKMLVLQKIADEINVDEQSRMKWTQQSPALVRLKVRVWCEKQIGRLLMSLVFGKDRDRDDRASRRERRIQKYSPHFKSATELITLFRPAGWQSPAHCAQKLMKTEVMWKWNKAFYLVHFADTVLPFGVILLLFGLMWWHRRLSVLRHHFWWSAQEVVAPKPSMGIEAACGWEAIRQSSSGRLQATLIVYGVPSLLRLALAQSRVRPSDIDEDLDWKRSWNEIVSAVFMNLEALFHLVVAGMFIAIGSARVTAQMSHDMYDCNVASLHTEKNCTSIAALVLFLNLFIVCKPYQGLGLLVQTTYRFLLKDVFSFLVMYGMLFTAFLFALQTLNNANADYLIWIETNDEILPQIEKVQNLSYLSNDNMPPFASSLLATETALEGCSSKRRDIFDTAFTLMEISFGDGLADSLEQARSKPYDCAGFTPDYLTSGLLMLWVFVTNVLFFNLLIAMMNKTVDKEIENIESTMLLDLSYRILRYERVFPEIMDWVLQSDHGASAFWKTWIDTFLLIAYCVPELHFLWCTCIYVPTYSQMCAKKRTENPHFWAKVKKAVEHGNTHPPPKLCLILNPFFFRRYLNIDVSRLMQMAQKIQPRIRLEQRNSETNDLRRLDWLIVGLDSIRAALNKSALEAKETGPKGKKGLTDNQGFNKSFVEEMGAESKEVLSEDLQSFSTFIAVRNRSPIKSNGISPQDIDQLRAMFASTKKSRDADAFKQVQEREMQGKFGKAGNNSQVYCQFDAIAQQIRRFHVEYPDLTAASGYTHIQVRSDLVKWLRARTGVERRSLMGFLEPERDWNDFCNGVECADPQLGTQVGIVSFLFRPAYFAPHRILR